MAEDTGFWMPVRPGKGMTVEDRYRAITHAYLRRYGLTGKDVGQLASSITRLTKVEHPDGDLVVIEFNHCIWRAIELSLVEDFLTV